MNSRNCRETPYRCPNVAAALYDATERHGVLDWLSRDPFPDNIAYRARFATTVVATASDYEKRNVNWSEARLKPAERRWLSSAGPTRS
jgi:hypothetical protein